VQPRLAAVISLLRLEIVDTEQHAEVVAQRRKRIGVRERHFERFRSACAMSEIK
jgi:hypothetical protein